MIIYEINYYFLSFTFLKISTRKTEWAAQTKGPISFTHDSFKRKQAKHSPPGLQIIGNYGTFIQWTTTQQ